MPTITNFGHEHPADIVRLRVAGGFTTQPDPATVVQMLLNNSGVALERGDLVVVDPTADEAVTTTTTAQDTHPAGIVQDDIDIGETGPVLTEGYADYVNVTAAVTRGRYAETSTTAKKATENATRRAGSFAIYLTSGTAPSALLFGTSDSSSAGSSPLTVEDEGTPLATAADTLNFVGAGVVASGAGASKTITIPGGGAGSGTPGWFNVKDPAYGATGDGVTDDRAAINLAIAALNAAGAGVLYFPHPADAYRCTAGLTAITADCIVMGDGSEGDHLAVRARPTLIECESATAVLFTTQALDVAFKDLGVRNTAGSTPSAGAGISVQSPGGSEPETARVIFENVKVEDFYDGFDIQVGAGWYMHGVHASSAVRYCIRVRNVVNGDIGDWEISDSWIYGYTHTPAAGIRIESSGGGRITNTKLIFPGDYGIDIVGGAGTSNLQLTNVSIESYRITGIRSTGSHPHQIYTNVQFGQYANGGSYGTGHAFDLSGNTDVIIDDVVFRTDAAGKTAIQHSSMTRFRVGSYVNNGFATVLSSAPDQDATGAVGAAVLITGTPSAGQVPVASGPTAAAWGTAAGGVTGLAAPAFTLGTANVAGAATTAPATDATIAAFDATVPAAIGTAATGAVAKTARRDHVHPTGAGTPSTQALGDAAATGTGPAAAMTDHKHAMPALSSATPLVESGAGAVGTALPSSREDHVHPAAADAGADHAHVVSETHLSNGSTTTWTLDQNYLSGSVIAWNTTTLARLGVTEVLPDQATVSAAGTSGDSIVFDYAAIVA